MNRITVVLDEDNEKMLRQLQVKKIKETNRAYSFSRCVNDVLRSKK